MEEKTPEESKMPETGGQNGSNFGSGAYSTSSTITTRNAASKRSKP
jgi:hypothetical protein